MISSIDRIERRRVLVIGSGVAGLSVALSLEGATVITKTPLGTGGSSEWAQGGIAVALPAGDSPLDHAADTLAVSAGLGDPEMVRILTEGGPAGVEWLIGLGARFDRDDRGNLTFGREAGHGRRRIVHANGDASGAEVMRAMRAAGLARPDLEEVEGEAIDLIRSGARVVGALVEGNDGSNVAYLAPAVVVATGGIGHVYSRTTSPRAVRGQGIAMAARAGARLADLEFVQFHPTALAAGADPMPLCTEALRGEGAVLVDNTGHRFMVDIHPDAELAPRDVVARANYRARAEGREPVLDARQAVGDAFPQRFPTVFNHAKEAGIDPRVEPLPVSPAVHYYMGGIDVDQTGRASLPGLWAVGEASSTGVHGANRLASNSLLEGLVFGRRVAADIESQPSALPADLPIEVPVLALDRAAKSDHGLVEELRGLMWDNVGVERDADRLHDAVARFGGVVRQAGPTRIRNLALVGGLIAKAALDREESRGSHYRLDFPELDPELGERRAVTNEPHSSVELAVAADRLVAAS